MTVDAALAQRGPRVAAWDPGDGKSTLSIVSVARDDAKVIARASIPLADRAAVERRLAQHGIPIGATHRGCDFVWVCDDEHLVVVQLDAGITLEASGADLMIAGRRVAIREVAAILSFVDRGDIGHRGVRIVLTNGDEITFAEEHDPMPAVDPTYGRMNLELDAGWIAMLGRDVAARLGVVHRDELWDREIEPPAAKLRGHPTTDALVEGLIDAYQHWDDPDRVAARAAREAAVSKRNEAILELAYLESGQRGDTPMDVAVAQMAAHFAGRIEQELPDTGAFTAIHQPLPEIENGGYVVLEIRQGNGVARVLELRVESPSGERTASEVLGAGSTADLVRYLRAATFADQLVPLVERLTEATRAGSADRPRTSTGPRARSSTEMRFFASLQSCPQCGTRVDPETFRIEGDGTAWALGGGTCQQCQRKLGYAFLTMDEDPIHAAPVGELGRGRSELIAPRFFCAEIADIEPTLFVDPTHLVLKEWRLHRDRHDRFELCIAELAKFFPEGADAIPEQLLAADDRADRDAHPDRYTRAWVDRARDHAKLVSTGIIADLPRIDRLIVAADVRRPKGIDWIEREALEAHERWVERGRKKKGKGRLIVVGAQGEAMKIGRGVELSGARFFDTQLPDVYLVDARLHDAELVETYLLRGDLYGAELVGATLKGGSLASADLETADLSRATIEATDFSGAELHLSTWDGADVSNAIFARAEFGDAKLDGAVFRGCDFRGAVFSADDPDDPPTTRARFERCDLRDTQWQARDLRGAVFVDCQLAGITGTPASIESVTIENADLSEAEIRATWAAIG